MNIAMILRSLKEGLTQRYPRSARHRGVFLCLNTRPLTQSFTTKQTGKGTGLDFAVGYGIIQSQNGNIKVESELGKGATFWVRLPIPAEVPKKASG